MYVVHPPNRSDPLFGSDDPRFYQTSRGSNNYFLQARKFIIFGPDVKTLFLTILLIVGPVAAFCAFVARKLIADRWGISVMLIVILFTLYELILLLLLKTSRMHTRKYIFFVMFLVSTTLLCVYVFGFCWVYIKRIMVNDEITSIRRAMIKTPASIVLIVYTFISFWFVGGLTVFHLYLISTNQITRLFASYCSESSMPAQSNLLLGDERVSTRPVFANIDANIDNEPKVSLVYLPWDVTTEILSRLPVKSLMRFKCVSKSFHDLISNNHLFKKNHLHHHRHLQSSMKILVPQCKNPGESVSSCSVSSITPGDDMIHELELPNSVGPLLYSHGRIHNSCDGLFCIEPFKCDHIIIWNPCTRQVKVLPACHPSFKERSLYPISWVGYSLAHDSRADVYKLLGLFYCSDLRRYRLCFYSSETEKWRYVDASPYPHAYGNVGYVGNPVIVNGAFHWLDGPTEHFKMPRVVVSLDVSDETYGTLALPKALTDGAKSDPMPCALRGKLCVFCRSDYGTHMELWVMNEYGVADSMTRMVSFSRVELPYASCWPLYMLGDDTVIIYRSGVTSFYRDGKFLCNTSVGTSYKFAHSYVYLESLISPSMIYLV